MTCEKLLRETLVLKSIQIGGFFKISHSSIFPFEYCTFDSRLRCHRFSVVAMKISPPSAPASSSNGSSSRESLDMQSRLPAAEVFIQTNSPSRSTSDSSRVAPLLPIDFGKCDMVLPAMRTSSTETFWGDDTITSANSGKIFVEQLGTLGGVDNTGGGGGGVRYGCFYFACCWRGFHCFK